MASRPSCPFRMKTLPEAELNDGDNQALCMRLGDGLKGVPWTWCRPDPDSLGLNRCATRCRDRQSAPLSRTRNYSSLCSDWAAAALPAVPNAGFNLLAVDLAPGNEPFVFGDQWFPVVEISDQWVLFSGRSPSAGGVGLRCRGFWRTVSLWGEAVGSRSSLLTVEGR